MVACCYQKPFLIFLFMSTTQSVFARVLASIRWCG